MHHILFMKVVFERQKCIGCGSCEAICPKHWKLAKDGKSQLLGSSQDKKTGNYEKEIGKSECNQEAADNCPVQCIHVEG